MSVDTVSEVAGTSDADALVERLFASLLGALDLFSIALGDRLGYFDMLAATGPATSVELAARSGTSERYAREWLEQQAVTGLLSVDEVTADAKERRYAIPDAFVELLTDRTSLSYVTPMARIFAGAVRPFDQLTEVFRTGEGIAFGEYGVDMLDGQAAMNRPHYENLLSSEWFRAMPDIYDRLAGDEETRIADIGMGAGWSSIAMAKAFPNAQIDGFELDEASVTLATLNAESEGVADRVTFHLRDAGDPDLVGRYDLATAFECIHDMSNPVAALSVMRRLVGEGGTALVMDERVEDAFTAPGGDVERMMYGFSILHCLPGAMVEEPRAATGTVMRSGTFRNYAEAAGFHDVEQLPVEHDFWRFYRLTA